MSVRGDVIRRGQYDKKIDIHKGAGKVSVLLGRELFDPD